MSTQTATAVRSDTLARFDPGRIGAWTLGFGSVGYLAVQGGAYDIVVRSQIGIAIWWIVLFGVAVGVLPHVRPSRTGLLVTGLLLALGAWSGLSATWSESPERAISETARIVTLLGLIVLAVLVIREQHIRPLVNGIFVAIAGIAALACLSRLHPAWFPTSQTAEFLPETRSRLSYPLNYWNALGALVAMGLPLGLALATTARTAAARAAATAALPVLALTAFLTFSRGAILEGAVAVVASFLLTAERGRWLGKAALAGSGTAILAVAVEQRHALRDGLPTALARHQGDELIVSVLVVVAGVALVHIGLSLASREGLLSRVPTVRPQVQRAAWLTAAASVTAALVIALSSGWAGDRWHEFKQPRLDVPAGQQHTVARLTASSGEGRYQFWASAVDAFRDAPVRGLGAGSFETWWTRHASLPYSIRNAHSLYAETLAELGLVGFLLLGGLIAGVLGIGMLHTLRATGSRRALLAGMTAACSVFVVAASVDWVWQVTVLPACFLLLAVALAAGPRAERTLPRWAGPVTGLLAAGALVSLAVPLAGTTELRDSQRAAAANMFSPALGHADASGRVQPYASSPALQRALVLEEAGDLNGAVAAARRAERKEPTNWRPPFVLARLETSRGHLTAALAAYRRAKALNRISRFLR